MRCSANQGSDRGKALAFRARTGTHPHPPVVTYESLEKSRALERVCCGSVDRQRLYMSEIRSPFNHCHREIARATGVSSQLRLSARPQESSGDVPTCRGRPQPNSAESSASPSTCFCAQSVRPTGNSVKFRRPTRSRTGRSRFRPQGALSRRPAQGGSVLLFALLRTAGLGTCQHSGSSYIRASFFPGIWAYC